MPTQRPARRPVKRRKTGCQNCRHRRIKCDEQTPCEYCGRLGLDCKKADFAARMQWTLSGDRSKANHHPVIDINGQKGLEPLYLELEAGSTFQLDASASYDPDPTDSLKFKWYQYSDPSATQWSVHHEVGELEIKQLNEAGSVAEVKLPPPEKSCVELISREAVRTGQLLHLVLEVQDNGAPALIRYRRILIQVTNEKLLGGGGGAEAIGDTMRNVVTGIRA